MPLNPAQIIFYVAGIATGILGTFYASEVAELAVYKYGVNPLHPFLRLQQFNHVTNSVDTKTYQDHVPVEATVTFHEPASFFSNTADVLNATWQVKQGEPNTVPDGSYSDTKELDDDILDAEDDKESKPVLLTVTPFNLSGLPVELALKVVFVEQECVKDGTCIPPFTTAPWYCRTKIVSYMFQFIRLYVACSLCANHIIDEANIYDAVIGMGFLTIIATILGYELSPSFRRFLKKLVAIQTSKCNSSKATEAQIQQIITQCDELQTELDRRTQLQDDIEQQQQELNSSNEEQIRILRAETAKLEMKVLERDLTIANLEQEKADQHTDNAKTIEYLDTRVKKLELAENGHQEQLDKLTQQFENAVDTLKKSRDDSTKLRRDLAIVRDLLEKQRHTTDEEKTAKLDFEREAERLKLELDEVKSAFKKYSDQAIDGQDEANNPAESHESLQEADESVLETTGPLSSKGKEEPEKPPAEIESVVEKRTGQVNLDQEKRALRDRMAALNQEVFQRKKTLGISSEHDDKEQPRKSISRPTSPRSSSIDSTTSNKDAKTNFPAPSSPPRTAPSDPKAMTEEPRSVKHPGWHKWSAEEAQHNPTQTKLMKSHARTTAFSIPKPPSHGGGKKLSAGAQSYFDRFTKKIATIRADGTEGPGDDSSTATDAPLPPPTPPSSQPSPPPSQASPVLIGRVDAPSNAPRGPRGGRGGRGGRGRGPSGGPSAAGGGGANDSFARLQERLGKQG